MHMHVLDAGCPVCGQQRLPIRLVIAQETVGGLGLGPASAGIGDALA